ncbi:hypothetical protein PSAL_031530 [Pseudooceanicola algae]|uniref:CBS domain-containing protein n=2 Tax=Pseudooceanicola algae TaxID=1537215 RepID=A0A418SJI6_9RHOB|nr:hypothetical protein PSAL_031530 [Pseudooceanicola algae]
MGDSTDGSPNAAQGARSMDPDPASISGAQIGGSVVKFDDAARSGFGDDTGLDAESGDAGRLGHEGHGLHSGTSDETERTNGASHAGLHFEMAANDPDGPDAPQRPGFLKRWLGFGGTPEDDSPYANQDTPRQSQEERRRHSLLNLREMRVEDVAIPKAEIVAVPSTINQPDLVAIFRESGMTRLPVYQGTLDSPTGMVHLKDFALKHGWNGMTRFSLKALLRPLLFVPPSMPIGVLLQKMQSERRHMALVIDEYGGVDGLVTIEDLIEQVIGEIEDEHDVDEDAMWSREASGSYLALAKAPLEDFEAEIGTSLTDVDAVDEEEIDTLGGLVFMLSGRVPARGEVVEHPEGHEFEVVEADPRRIKKLRVRLNTHVPLGENG